ncbi:hypothetical protein BS638_00605 [Clostridium tepidum]|jgi:hypothetical protein|uniref:DUF3885 domain-containing protein n=1 Tax=Clostridium tepidum TaxID=1962263 RepID=A0A1S9II11_9CLOT|nr:hypothetical protein [Clostridium tepidum]OOO69918.1 hypothetical protein BS638_00605 [Clostridium tepidum]
MTDMDKSLKDILMEILKEYDFKGGPLFKLAPKLRLHSALAYKYSYLEKEEFDKVYIGKTVEKASHIFKELNFKGDLLLVYDNAYNKNPEKEISFIESTLVNIKKKEDYSYDWFDKYDEEIYHARRTIYQVEALKIEDLFRQISLSDFAGDYDLESSIYIIDLKSKTIFYFYDDRGIYIMAREERILNDLWKALPDCFFEDCHDFEIKIKKLYWIDGSENNREDLCLHGDLEIRLNDKVIKYSPTVSAAGLRLLRSLFDDHQGGKGNHLFPCCGNTMIANEELDKVEIIGCDEGLDWSVSHKDGFVTVKADENIKTTYYYLQYKKEVLNFIKEVKNFYKKAGERILPEDKMESEGYLAFWREWEDLKERATLI